MKNQVSTVAADGSSILVALSAHIDKIRLRRASKFYSRAMEPPFYYVRDKASSAAHHWDYLRNRRAKALCGQDYVDPQWEGSSRPSRICRSCQEKLPLFEAKWWRKTARRVEIHRSRLEAENAELRGEVTALKRQMDQLTYQLELSMETIENQKQKINNQRKTLSHLQHARSPKPNTPERSSGSASATSAKKAKAKSTFPKTGVWRSADQVPSSGAGKRSKPPAPR